MKKIIQIFSIALIALQGFSQENVELSMGANYADRVFYKLSNGTTNQYNNNDWDVAFYRMSNYVFGVRINDGKGIKVYEASDVPANWASIDVSDSGSWTQLYNNDTDWTDGAFNQGSATYGWGEYNPVNHHVVGAVIFVLEYADGSFKKFFIEDFFGGFTFKYSSWNGSAWSADTTKTISNTSNENNQFNYYSLENDAEVIAEPALNQWDLVFTKYITDLGGGTMYSVTGALHNPNVVVAKHDETEGEPNLEELDYKEEINTIGYNWKTFTGGTYVIDTDTGYYVKYENTQIYRIIFESFEGGSTGNLSFNVKYMGQLSTNDVVLENSFAMFPNPATNNKVDILFNIENTSTKHIDISIYTISGSKVYETTLEAQNGFSQKTIQLDTLQSGVYFVNAVIGQQNLVKKLIVK